MIKKNDDVEIEQSEEHSDAFAVRKKIQVFLFCNFKWNFLWKKAYYAYDNDESNSLKEPIYNDDLGLAVERLKDGFQIKNLWDILNSWIVDLIEKLNLVFLEIKFWNIDYHQDIRKKNTKRRRTLINFLK